MAISKNSVITAADINSFNAKKELVYSGLPEKTIGSDDDNWYYSNIWFRNDDKYNVLVDLDDDNQYQLRFYTDVSYSTEIFRWVGDEESPDINTPGWGTQMAYYSPDKKYIPSVNIPSGTEVFIRIRYEDKVFQSRPKAWVLRLTRGQTDNAVGDNIRVWDANFTTLLPEGAKKITVAVANSGVLGHE